MITAVAVSGTGCSQTQPASIDYKTADKVADGAILQAFCWDFNTIKESMGDIAAAGFSAVQTSPINECLEGEDGGMDLYGNGKWYYHYQPTDFKIGNYQLGTRDEFKAMCDEAHKYGIKVIVDVIANHTTPATDEVSEDLIEAGGGSLETLYHKEAERPLMISATDLPAPRMRWEDFPTSTRKDLRFKSISLITLTIVLPAVPTVSDMTRQSISDFPMIQKKMTALKITSGKKQQKKLITQKIFLSTAKCFRATMTDLRLYKRNRQNHIKHLRQ